MEVTINKIEKMIYVIRGQKVMLDSDLAELYGVDTKRLNEQVRRNIDRFPEDFMFECKSGELDVLRSQIATANASTNCSNALENETPVLKPNRKKIGLKDK